MRDSRRASEAARGMITEVKEREEGGREAIWVWRVRVDSMAAFVRERMEEGVWDHAGGGCGGLMAGMEVNVSHTIYHPQHSHRIIKFVK